MIKTQFSSNAREIFVLICLISVTQFSSHAYAQYLSGPVSQALGGSGLAANDEAEQFLLNPAALVHSKDAAIGYFYSDGYRDKNEHDNFYGVTLSDNSEDVLVAGGAAFFKRRRTFDNFSTLDELKGQFSFAKVLYKHISVGLSVDYLQSDADGDKKYKQWDGTIGILYNPNPDLAFAAIFRNLAPTDKDIPAPIRNVDEIGLGVHYILLGNFRGRLDVLQPQQLNPEKDYIVRGGLESLLDAYMAVRLGFENNGVTDRHSLSAGIGMVGPRLKIDYSYVKNTDYNGGGMHSVDFRLPF